ncbi:uncharacterized protein [Prorops nasuta]|uniref:uncharacterized protein n=1 Tax=Prorops nasuta TaxID=863751 RepID=UPI0034CF8063
MWIALCLTDAFRSNSIETYKDKDWKNFTIFDEHAITVKDSAYFAAGFKNVRNIIFKLCTIFCIFILILSCTAAFFFIYNYLRKRENSDVIPISSILPAWMTHLTSFKRTPVLNLCESLVSSEEPLSTISVTEVNYSIEENKNEAINSNSDNELIYAINEIGVEEIINNDYITNESFKCINDEGCHYSKLSANYPNISSREKDCDTVSSTNTETEVEEMIKYCVENEEFGFIENIKLKYDENNSELLLNQSSSDLNEIYSENSSFTSMELEGTLADCFKNEIITRVKNTQLNSNSQSFTYLTDRPKSYTQDCIKSKIISSSPAFQEFLAKLNIT